MEQAMAGNSQPVLSWAEFSEGVGFPDESQEASAQADAVQTAARLTVYEKVLWRKATFVDLFSDPYLGGWSGVRDQAPPARLEQTLEFFTRVLDSMARHTPQAKAASEVMQDAISVARWLKRSTEDRDLADFLSDLVTKRLAPLRVGGVMLAPIGWGYENGEDKNIKRDEWCHLALLVVHRSDERSCSVAFCNTGEGLQYHGAKIEAGGALKRNLSFVLEGVPWSRFFFLASLRLHSARNIAFFF